MIVATTSLILANVLFYPEKKQEEERKHAELLRSGEQASESERRRAEIIGKLRYAADEAAKTAEKAAVNARWSAGPKPPPLAPAYGSAPSTLEMGSDVPALFDDLFTVVSEGEASETEFRVKVSPRTRDECFVLLRGEVPTLLLSTPISQPSDGATLHRRLTALRQRRARTAGKNVAAEMRSAADAPRKHSART